VKLARRTPGLVRTGHRRPGGREESRLGKTHRLRHGRRRHAFLIRYLKLIKARAAKTTNINPKARIPTTTE
jgi:hypothetical protein